MPVELLTKDDLASIQNEMQEIKEIVKTKLEPKRNVAPMAPVEPLLVKKDRAKAMLGGVSEHVLRELRKDGRLKPVRIIKDTGEKLYSVAQIQRLVKELLLTGQ